MHCNGEVLGYLILVFKSLMRVDGVSDSTLSADHLRVPTSEFCVGSPIVMFQVPLRGGIKAESIKSKSAMWHSGMFSDSEVSNSGGPLSQRYGLSVN